MNLVVAWHQQSVNPLESQVTTTTNIENEMASQEDLENQPTTSGRVPIVSITSKTNTKASGRGKTIGRGGAKRHHKVLRDSIQDISITSIRRLARRAGVKRISALIFEDTRGALKFFLESVIRDAVIYTGHANRNTVTAMDVVYALKYRGHTLYGFGG